jgi:hypothetical protein
MIDSIKHKGLKLLFEHGDGSKLPPDLLSRIRLILAALEAAPTIEFEPADTQAASAQGQTENPLGCHGPRELAHHIRVSRRDGQ